MGSGNVRNDEAIYAVTAVTAVTGITELSHEVNIDIGENVRILMSEILNSSRVFSREVLDAVD
ncbi:MAG: hypothetical protein E7L02_05505 [Cutibacterium avidum]|uniref:hypothetical protein n=1 Tax=Cutibacterium avidum TaxID=33010 RepID=UPI000408ECE6|nr:hypothetical protein [Cutibacterium avidum]MCG7369608.1 hypothetical protein [Cutibacterium avidum]MDU4920553.1 hypothetical protein [Cutibacterium avidum]MDU7387014.1 hypothetical protein [Cutibacterium avidum]MDY0817908.1 hypothetical protein [Cutibacterium avidum]BDY01587.1 hypothetical protein TPCV302_09790 [Cutibacterium avidum]